MTTLSPISYQDAGVDITLGDRAVDAMKPCAAQTHTRAVISGIGGFSALFALKDAMPNLQDPVLVSGTDGVGTKLLVALDAKHHEDIGQDLVAMCANDVLCVGAKPLFFLDYFASSELKHSPLLEVIKSIAAACKSIDCALIGGETAEMPGLYATGHYDLAGFCVGVVDRSKLIDGKKMKSGDQIIGLRSSGLHSNGFSLARKIIFERMRKNINDVLYIENNKALSVADALLAPTQLYVNPILALLDDGAPIQAMAHITGGGLGGNLLRSFPGGLSANIDKQAWAEPPIFDVLRQHGPVIEEEMRRTFNLGIGFALVVPKNEANAILQVLDSLGEKAVLIGEVVEGNMPLTFLE